MQSRTRQDVFALDFLRIPLREYYESKGNTLDEFDQIFENVKRNPDYEYQKFANCHQLFNSAQLYQENLEMSVISIEDSWNKESDSQGTFLIQKAQTWQKYEPVPTVGSAMNLPPTLQYWEKPTAVFSQPVCDAMYSSRPLVLDCQEVGMNETPFSTMLSPLKSEPPGDFQVRLPTDKKEPCENAGCSSRRSLFYFEESESHLFNEEYPTGNQNETSVDGRFQYDLTSDPFPPVPEVFQEDLENQHSDDSAETDRSRQDHYPPHVSDFSFDIGLFEEFKEVPEFERDIDVHDNVETHGELFLNEAEVREAPSPNSPGSVDTGYSSEGSRSRTSSEISSVSSVSRKRRINGDSPDDRKKSKRPYASRNTKWPKLWELLRFLLDEEELFGSTLRWTDRELGRFTITDNEHLTLLYNSSKRFLGQSKEEAVDFNSITRAIRHQYRKRVFILVPHKRMYQFGPNAELWQSGVSRKIARDALTSWLDHFLQSM